MAASTRVEQALATARRALDEVGARYAVVGGLAVSARSEPRLTRDVDFAVAVSGDAAAEALVHALVQRGWEVLAAVEQTVTGRLATARLTPPGDDDAGVVVDLLFASCGFEPEIVVEADEMELTDDVSLPVACTGHLLVMKLLARDDRTRPNDADDLRALAAVVDAGEIARARAAARLVQARGFHRGRDVPALLEAMLTDEHQR